LHELAIDGRQRRGVVAGRLPSAFTVTRSSDLERARPAVQKALETASMISSASRMIFLGKPEFHRNTSPFLAERADP
jgi:hypothetical protein